MENRPQKGDDRGKTKDRNPLSSVKISPISVISGQPRPSRLDIALRALVFLLVLFPFLFLLTLSLGRQWTFPVLLPREWSIANWVAALGQRGDLGQSLLLSLGLALSVAALSTAFGFLTSKALSEHPRGRLLLGAAYLPYVFAPVILAAVLQVFFLRLGLTGRPGGVLLGQLLIAYPFAVILFSSFWNERMRAFGQLAATLGASRLQAYRLVLLPLARGPLLITFFQTFLISWFEYGLTVLLGVGKVQTLPVKVFQFVNEANIYYAALAGLLLALPPTVLLWVNKQWVFREE